MTVMLSTFATGLDHPEGVAWCPAGWLASGGEAGQIYSVTLAGTVRQIATTGGNVLGMAFDGSNNLYVCDMSRSAVLRVDTTTGKVDNLTSSNGHVVVRVPNFPVFTNDGHLFFSDSGEWGADDGAVLVLTPSGEVKVASTDASGYTNGLAVDPAGEFLYVAETSESRISRLALLSDGRLGPRQTAVVLPGALPDGIAFATDGTLLIACYRPDAIYAWNGDMADVMVSDWTGITLNAPTNLAFFGDQLDRLVVANLAGRHLAELTTELRGSALNYPIF
jgi:gluconolactonase